jgi:hypothetical protein
MNSTTNKTIITISTTDAKRVNKYAIKKRVERDAFGRAQVAEYVRGIRL